LSKTRKSRRENVREKIKQEKEKLNGSKSVKRILSIFLGVSATDGAELSPPPLHKTNDVRQELKFSMQSAISNHLSTIHHDVLQQQQQQQKTSDHLPGWPFT